MASMEEIELVGIPTVSIRESESRHEISEVITETESAFNSDSEAEALIESGTTENESDPSGQRRYPWSYRALKFSFNLHLMAVFGGMTIGYAQTIIGGILDMESFLKKFSPARYQEKMYTDTNNYCSYVNTWIQFSVGALPTLVACSYTLGLLCSAKWGKKIILRYATILISLAVAILQYSPDVGFQVAGIVPLGFGVGFLYQAAPKLVSELADESIRKRLSVVFSCSVTLGSAMASGVNWRASLVDEGWKTSYFILCIPLTALYGLIFLFVRESPVWLVEQRQEQKAKETLRKIRDTLDVDYAFNDIKQLVEWKRNRNPWKDVFSSTTRPTLVITTVFSIFPSLLGYSIFASYGPLLIQSWGLTVVNDSFVVAFGVSVAILLVTCIQPLILSKLGRRHPFIIACYVMMTATISALPVFGMSVTDYTYLASYEIPMIAIGIGMYMISQVVLFGPAGPLKVGFPSSTADVGDTLAIWTSLCFSSIVTLFFSRLVCAIRFNIFLLYCGGNLTLLLFVWFFLPETLKAKTHTVGRKVWAKHWFWYKYANDEDTVYV